MLGFMSKQAVYDVCVSVCLYVCCRCYSYAPFADGVHNKLLRHNACCCPKSRLSSLSHSLSLRRAVSGKSSCQLYILYTRRGGEEKEAQRLPTELLNFTKMSVSFRFLLPIFTFQFASSQLLLHWLCPASSHLPCSPLPLSSLSLLYNSPVGFLVPF